MIDPTGYIPPLGHEQHIGYYGGGQPGANVVEIDQIGPNKISAYCLHMPGHPERQNVEPKVVSYIPEPKAGYPAVG